jgi:hypothetical protein
MCECWTSSRTLPADLLWKDVPQEHHGDLDFVVSLLDWEKNVDPAFSQSRFMSPIPAPDAQQYLHETWVVYRSSSFSAKELTLDPGRQAVVHDAAAYGCIIVYRGEAP